ncbi:MAG TPA: HD domain-containing phosphohydrolase [Thermoanaerobaculia bacterium]|jgi:HD-GYP domain-containing protein (c-di-GMP phosphodiesterase class II)
MTTSIQVSGGRTPIEEARLIEPALKRALYECLERIRATKAALYLATSYGTSQVYELVTSYGWTAPPPRLDERYPIVARLLANRLPLMVNSLGADRFIGELLFEQGSERALALPIFGRGRRLVGIVDLRDKAGQKPFEPADAAAADTVREAIEKELAAKGLYGVGDGSVVETPKRRRGSSAKYSAVMRAEAALLPETLVRPETTASPGAAEVIRAARGRMAKRVLDREVARRILTREEIERLRIVLPAVLAIPGVVAGVLTNLTARERQIVVSNAPLADDALRLINDRLAMSLKRREVATAASRANWSANLDRNAVTSSDIQIVASAAVAPKSVDDLVLTVALSTKPTDEARAQIEALAEQLGVCVEAIVGRSQWQQRRITIAEALIEPDFRPMPMLAGHSRLVAGIAQRLAEAMKMPQDFVDTVRVAALVHDVGLRLLDYEKLGVQGRLTDEQTQIVMEHPLVGAALVEPYLGRDVAEVVLRHHERFDGHGYPGRLAGDRIPLAARVVQIADCWAAMTSPESYVANVGRDEAMHRLRKDAGAQFDPSLVGTFIAAVDEIVG